MRHFRLVLLIAVCLGVARYGWSRTQAPGFVETSNFLAGVDLITDMEFAPDDSQRLFISGQAGTIWIVKNGAVLSEPFLVIDPLPYMGGETGLLGFCFDPDFISNGFVYVFVTVSASEQRIMRYTAAGDLATQETIIVAGLPTVGRDHNGGAIAVGQDGKLYWGIGDNNAPGADTNLTTLASKIGRANLDGSVPELNPYVNADSPHNPYIWARGFRNPFRCAFQPSTGVLWVNVAGYEYEQIFAVERGQDGGWTRFEGNQQEPAIVPKIKYATAPQAAVTGGCFYNSTAFPAQYHENYFYCEYMRGFIWNVALDGENNVKSIFPFVHSVERVIDVLTGPDGALYYVGHRTNILYRAAYVPTNGVQNLIVSPVYLNMAEGGVGVVNVSLAVQPTNDVVVTVGSGSGSLQIRPRTKELLFTRENYSTPQPAYMEASADNDTFASHGTITFSSGSLPHQQVCVNAYDRDGGKLQFTSIALSNNDVSLTLSTERSVGLSLQASADLQPWELLSTNYATNDLMKIFLPESSARATQFYRVRTIPP